MGKDEKIDPKERILDVAEKIFAESGFEGASMREIVRAAKVNLATVYYYFESKEGLLWAVLDRRFDPFFKEQKEALKKLQEEPDKYTLEDLIVCMLRTPLRIAESEPSRSQIIRRLIGRMVTEPHRMTQEANKRRHKDLRDGFINLIKSKLPYLDEKDLQWRFEFIWGALFFILCNPQKVEYMSGGLCNPSDTAQVLKQLVRFCSAGLKAPGVGEDSQNKNSENKKDLNNNNQFKGKL
ncbi:MAG: TetR/AcrR family transcriptional regulator [Verrucomicrobiae bacterium]|nr:TetR/AcrR family transcriptional regulator [Verrucomicrobiae bacterium]